MTYLVVLSFFTGVALGYIVSSFLEEIKRSFKLHEFYLEETRKTLEKTFIENESLETNNEEDK